VPETKSSGLSFEECGSRRVQRCQALGRESDIAPNRYAVGGAVGEGERLVSAGTTAFFELLAGPAEAGFVATELGGALEKCRGFWKN
jgi:hypothetical protein